MQQFSLYNKAYPMAMPLFFYQHPSILGNLFFQAD